MTASSGIRFWLTAGAAAIALSACIGPGTPPPQPPPNVTGPNGGADTYIHKEGIQPAVR